MVTNYYQFRKNWGMGVMSIELIPAPGYPDDPLYDEIAVDEGHTLPGSSATDGSTMDDVFTLIIWSVSENPGSDPNMEIVTARRTTHPRVYQIVARGQENTPVSAHPVGSFVSHNYTAGVSYHDLVPIQAILNALVGSIIYTWTDVYDNREIGILPPGTSGMVLHTAGANQPPYWDWVYGYANRTFNLYILTGFVLNIETMNELLLHTITHLELYTDYSTDSYVIDIEFLDSNVEGSFEITSQLGILNLSGDSNSEPTIDKEISESNLYTLTRIDINDVWVKGFVD